MADMVNFILYVFYDNKRKQKPVLPEEGLAAAGRERLGTDKRRSQRRVGDGAGRVDSTCTHTCAEKRERRENSRCSVCTRCPQGERGPVAMAASGHGPWATGARVGRIIFDELFGTSQGSGEEPSSAFDWLCDLRQVI